MNDARLRFTHRAPDAPPAAPAGRERDTVVVLDPWWVPPADGQAAVPITRFTDPILRRHDLVTESLDRLDDWAERAGLPAAFHVDGVAWWPRARMAVRWDAQLLLLWRRVLADAVPSDGVREVVIPATERQLAAVARAGAAQLPGRPKVTIVDAAPAAPAAPAAAAALGTAAGLLRLRRAVGRVLRFVVGVARRVARRPPPVRRAAVLEARLRLLEARVAGFEAHPPDVLAVAWATAFQVVGEGDRARRVDPQLAPVLERLEAEGLRAATLVSAMGYRSDADWAALEADPTLIPRAVAPALDKATAAARRIPAALEAAVRSAAAVPLVVDGLDLAPAMAEAVASHARESLAPALLDAARLERLLGRLQPGVIFLDREATRASTLAAARRLGIPVVAVQHGMVYPRTPEYCQPDGPTLRPDRTCVFGPWERDLLVEQCGYPADGVVVTGSPRSDPAAHHGPLPEAEREAVRRDLGVAPGERLLVVSVAHNQLGDLYAAEFLARLLPEPPPGVHVVVKLHPQDRADAGHARLLAALAARAGRPAPRVSLVHDIDLYRLLRSADVHLGQHSTVLTDAVVVGMPNLVAVGQGYADPIGYAAAGVAVPVATSEALLAALIAPAPPSGDVRAAFLAAHLAPGDATGRIAEVLCPGASRGRASSGAGA